jgi:hypothetical protein
MYTQTVAVLGILDAICNSVCSPIAPIREPAAGRTNLGYVPDLVLTTVG